MSKTISSIFILLLLFLMLWGVSSWLIGKNNEESLKLYLDTNQSNSDSFFKLSILESSNSILGSKSKVLLNLNSNNEVANLLEDSFGELLLSIDIKNGPILFNKAGFSFGKSAWGITFNKNNIDAEINTNSNLKHNTAYLQQSFENNIEYHVPLNLSNSNIQIKGVYDTNTSKNKGTITSDKLTFKNDRYFLQSNELDLKYIVIQDKINDQEREQKFYIKSTFFKVLFRHKNMEKSLNLKTNIDGNIFIKNNTLNSTNNISFMNANGSTYPIDNGKFNLKISDLDLLNVTQLIDDISEVKNLNKQAQWVLEEQGELPEGQDQIWQLQDQVKRFETTLINTTSKAINNDIKKMPVFKFSFVNQYQGNQSIVKGKIDSFSESLSNKDINDLSVFSLIEVNANVTLNELMFKYLSGKIPIKKKQFSLSYRDNKLLMQ